MLPDLKKVRFEDVSLPQLESVAVELLSFAGNHRVVVFHGEMGAGKTTFIKAFCKVLGVYEPTGSPTFSIVNEYRNEEGSRIYHFDFYRLKESEAYDIGVDEYFDSGNFCLVEWPEKIPSLLPLQYAEVFITVMNETHRIIEFSIHD
jgi:tRNA threonylcarbamoyladenosine biosynthesis protein TsaE